MSVPTVMSIGKPPLSVMHPRIISSIAAKSGKERHKWAKSASAVVHIVQSSKPVQRERERGRDRSEFKVDLGRYTAWMCEM